MNNQSKKAYQEKTEAQLKEIKVRMKLLEAKADKVKAEAKVKYNEQLADLRQKQELVEARFNKLKAEGSEAWREFTSGIDEAMSTLRHSVDEALAQFG